MAVPEGVTTLTASMTAAPKVTRPATDQATTCEHIKPVSGAFMSYKDDTSYFRGRFRIDRNVDVSVYNSRHLDVIRNGHVVV